MRRKLIAAVPLAAASAVSAMLLSPGVANAAPPTHVQLQNWTVDPAGSFIATGKTLCASGTWSVNTGVLVLTCSNGSITFGQTTGKFHGLKMTGIFPVTSGTGAFAGATGQLAFVQDSGSTGVFSGTIS
jgi:hypothetical protein